MWMCFGEGTEGCGEGGSPSLRQYRVIISMYTAHTQNLFSDVPHRPPTHTTHTRRQRRMCCVFEKEHHNLAGNQPNYGPVWAEQSKQSKSTDEMCRSCNLDVRLQVCRERERESVRVVPPCSLLCQYATKASVFLDSTIAFSE